MRVTSIMTHSQSRNGIRPSEIERTGTEMEQRLLSSVGRNACSLIFGVLQVYDVTPYYKSQPKAARCSGERGRGVMAMSLIMSPTQNRGFRV
ncbi:hypothetical protein L596_022559 [Steinernema carpocapsae]|uniref:Uncharacterized protein n=1 Tax=Steinernema carpocapsae TaxID=34508 RepID=A0A4U5MM19_STECR|nr:hypothetical protein L596_022559 [Steinernema carpocapsae]